MPNRSTARAFLLGLLEPEVEVPAAPCSPDELRDGGFHDALAQFRCRQVAVDQGRDALQGREQHQSDALRLLLRGSATARILAGGVTAAPAQTRQMLDFAARHNIGHVRKGRARYRVVVEY